MSKQKGDDLAKDLEETVDKGEFLDFDKDGTPKKADLVSRVLARFVGEADLRRPV